MAAAGLPTLPRVLLTADGDPPPFDGPFIVKPRFGGSSIGIDVVEDFATAVARLEVNPHLRFGAVVEPYRPDMTDLQVAVRTWPAWSSRPWNGPSGSRGPSTSSATATSTLPARVWPEPTVSSLLEIPSELEKGIRQAAERIAALAEVRGVARIDYLSDGDQFVVNEINTVPGSLARHLWVAPPDSLCRLARRPPRRGPTAPDTRLLGRRGRRLGPPFGRIHCRQIGLTHLAVRGIHLLPGEKVLVDIRPHWSFLSGPFTVSLLAIAIGVALDVAIPHTSVALHWVEGLVVAVPCVWLAIRVVRWRMTRLVLTSERIIEQWGVVSRRQSESALVGHRGSDRPPIAAPPYRRHRPVGGGDVGGAEIRWIEDVRKPVILQRVINRRLLPPSTRTLMRADHPNCRLLLAPSPADPARGHGAVAGLHPPRRGRHDLEGDGSRPAHGDHATAESCAGHASPEDSRVGDQRGHQFIDGRSGHFEVLCQAPMTFGHERSRADQVVRTRARQHTGAPAGTR